MISKLTKELPRYLYLILAVLALCNTEWVLAGTEPISRDATINYNNLSAETNKGSELKCWQNGRLLFEEHNWEPVRTSGTYVLMKSAARDGKFGNLLLYSFGNETFCYLKN